MKTAIALIAAITLVTFTSAQPTTCTQDDINELRSVTARVEQCIPTYCSANRTRCQCCVTIRDSGDSTSPAYNCCQDYATGVALYRQCKDVIDQQSGNNTNTAKFGITINLFENCMINLNLFNNNAGETIRALSFLAMLSIAALASLLF